MRERVVIIGVGGHGKVVADTVRKNDYIVVGFLDDAYENEKEIYGSKIYGRVNKYAFFKENCCFTIAIGNNKIRERISKQLKCRWYTGIHPTAVVNKSAFIGVGTVVIKDIKEKGTYVGVPCKRIK